MPKEIKFRAWDKYRMTEKGQLLADPKRQAYQKLKKDILEFKPKLRRG